MTVAQTVIHLETLGGRKTVCFHFKCLCYVCTLSHLSALAVFQIYVTFFTGQEARRWNFHPWPDWVNGWWARLWNKPRPIQMEIIRQMKYKISVLQSKQFDLEIHFCSSLVRQTAAPCYVSCPWLSLQSSNKQMVQDSMRALLNLRLPGHFPIILWSRHIVTRVVLYELEKFVLCLWLCFRALP